MALHHRQRYPWQEMFQKVGDMEIFPDKTTKQVYPVMRNYILKTFGPEAIFVLKDTPVGAAAVLVYIPGYTPGPSKVKSPVNHIEDDEEDISEYEGIADE